jgi:hypothetical protein
MFPSRWWFSSSLSEGAALDERSQRLAVDSDLAGPSLIVLDDAESSSISPSRTRTAPCTAPRSFA